MTAIAVAQAILALMPLITTGTENLVAFIEKVRSAAQQTGEWPPEAEAAYQARILAKADSPAAQLDANAS